MRERAKAYTSERVAPRILVLFIVVLHVLWGERLDQSATENVFGTALAAAPDGSIYVALNRWSNLPDARPTPWMSIVKLAKLRPFRKIRPRVCRRLRPFRKTRTRVSRLSPTN